MRSEAFSILAVGSFPQTADHGGLPACAGAFQYPRCWIVSSDRMRAETMAPVKSNFQYPRCWIVSSDYFTLLCNILVITALSVSSLLDRFLRLKRAARRPSMSHLSVSSLLDRFLRPFCAAAFGQNKNFQYPRCWIVSSDSRSRQASRRRSLLSVSSLLDRFLRPRCLLHLRR